MPQKCLLTIASPDTNRVEWVMEALTDEYTVVVTTEKSDIFQQHGRETDVILLDPAYDEDVVNDLTSTNIEPEYGYQLGILTDSRQSSDFDADAVISRALSADDIRERIDWLVARARYCKTLSEYYEVTRMLVERQQSDCRSVDFVRLRVRRDRLESRLDEISDPLDSKTLYDAVLG